MFKQLINLLRSDGSIVVNKALARSIGLTGATLYSELVSKYVYFSNNGTLGENGFFYCTIEDLEHSTSLSRNEQDAAIRKLVAIGLIEKKVMKTSRDSAPKRYFRIIEDEALVLSLLSDKARTSAMSGELRLIAGDNIRFAENQQIDLPDYTDSFIEKQEKDIPKSDGIIAVSPESGIQETLCCNEEKSRQCDETVTPDRFVENRQLDLLKSRNRFAENQQIELLESANRNEKNQQFDFPEISKSICGKPAGNNTNINNTNRINIQSVSNSEEDRLKDEFAELQAIKDRCELYLLPDKETRRLIENCLETIFFSKYLQVGNARFPQCMVRSRMHQFNGSTVLYALDKLKTQTVNTEKVTNSTGYLCSCLMNAAVEYSADAVTDPALNRYLYSDTAMYNDDG